MLSMWPFIPAWWWQANLQAQHDWLMSMIQGPLQRPANPPNSPPAHQHPIELLP